MEPQPGTKEYAEKAAGDANLREALYALNRAMNHTEGEVWDDVRFLRDNVWRVGAERYGWKD